MDVSVVIVNYKTSELTHNVVQSIFEMTKDVSFEIIIVDNSNDKIEFSKLSDLKNKATIIDAQSNLGFGKGNNLGAKFASGEFLLFLNSDTILLNDAISTMYKEAKGFCADIVGPNIFTKDKKPNISYEFKQKTIFRDTTLLFCLLKRFSSNYYFNHKNKNMFIPGYISGACLMIQKHLFENLGGFNEKIFMYAEESLLCFEAVKNYSAKIMNVPNAKIIHLEGQSFNTNKARIERFIEGNYLYYFYAFNSRIALKYLKKAVSFYRKKEFFAKILNRNKAKLFGIYKECYINKYESIKGEQNE